MIGAAAQPTPPAGSGGRGWAAVRRRSVIAAALLATGLVPTPAASGEPAAAPPATAAPAPRRVVSVNLCTDQLAMLLAAPGQLVSVSHLARDPRSSAMAAEAAAYPLNRGGAEEVYLMRPDLVLAGSFGGAPVAMLDRLGVRVVTLPPPASLDDLRAGIETIGAALGREAAAAKLLAALDARLARLRRPVGPDAPLAATWGANGYSAGSATLAGDVLTAAGYTLLADRLGLRGAGNIPLETLVMADPALIVTGTRYPRASRAEEVVHHPALESLDGRVVEIADADWTCGIPQVLDALEKLASAVPE